MTEKDSRPVPGFRESVARLVRVAALLRPYWGSYGKLAGYGLVAAGAGLLGPYLTKLLIDGVYPSGDVSLLGLLVAAIAAHGLFLQGVNLLRNYFGQVVSAHLSADATVFLFNHVQHLPLRFFERMASGDILSRFGDLRSSLGSVRALFDLVFLRGVFLLLIPPILVLMNWRLACIAFASIPLTWGLNVATAKALRRRWRGVAEANAEVRALNVENLSHIRLLKSMGLEQESFRQTAHAAGVARQETVATAKLSMALGAGNGLARLAGSLLLTYVGWRIILGGGMTLGSYIAFTAYLAQIQGPLARMTSLFSQFQRTAITLDRVFELLDEAPESDPTLLYDGSGGGTPIRIAGPIRLDGLRFGYGPTGFNLDIADLTLPEGGVTGLVGESGSGKSTLLRLIAGLERPGMGTIWYGPHTHSALSLASIRSSVAVAWQTPELLRGSLRSNIVYGVKEVSEAKLQDVLAVCHLVDLVAVLPDGLETPVAEWGSTLSGGEQQRLSLARALVRDTPVLLLDEVTSNLDPLMEERLMQDLMEFTKGRTVVLASHRPSTIRYVDQVVKVTAGRVVLESVLTSERDRGRDEPLRRRQANASVHGTNRHGRKNIP